MKIGDSLADFFTQHAEERRLRRLDGDNLQALLLKRCRDFRPDEPHAHDDGPAAGDYLRPNTIGVLNRAETINAFKTRRRESKCVGFARLWR